MASCLKLYIPLENELEYRQKLIANEETMAYNTRYGDNGTGVYNQTIDEVKHWYKNWNNFDSGNYYAYIVRSVDNLPIGEVNIHFSDYCQKHMVGLIIESKYRGMGYGEQALRLLAEVAFNKLGLNVIYDDFPEERTSAWKLFQKVGFIREIIWSLCQRITF